MEERKVQPGFRSGLLEVVSEAPRIKGRKMWLCRCDCGGEKVVSEHHLKTEHTKSCGCISRKPLAVGMHFGQLTIISEAPKKSGVRYWHCRCTCGNACTVQESHLRSDHTKSCGCLSRKHPTYSPGMKIGNLLLLEEAPRKGGIRFWYCRCDCGNLCTVQESHLQSGHTKSCGCLIRKAAQERAFDLYGRRFDRLLVVGQEPERSAGVPRWLCRCDCGNEVYVEAEYLLRDKTKSCGCLREDQRKVNMATAIHFVDGTCIEKIACQKEIATNTSGHRGVTQRKNGTWRAAITFRGKRHDLGTHKTFEEAVEARLKGEEMITEFLDEYYARQKEASV